MLKNPNHPEGALFAPMANGSFRRYSGLTGKPLDFHPDREAGGLFDLNGQLAFGQMPRGEAHDAMPELWDKSATKQSQSTGSRDEDKPEGKGARKSGPAELLQSPFEPDGGGFLPEIQPDQEAAEGAGEGGGGKAAHAAKLLKLLKDKLSPTDYVEFCQRLADALEGGEGGEEGEEGEARDMPPAYPGRPTPGGKMVGDARRQFEKQWPELSRISIDRTGEQAAPRLAPRPRPSSARQSPLALDSESLARTETDPILRAAIEGARRCGRCY